MRTAVVYIFPNLGSNRYHGCAKRFAWAYMHHPPGGHDHDLYVVVNGPQLTPRQEELFAPLAPNFIYHNNAGKDIGAYQMASKNIPNDLIVCLGAPARPCVTGWLDRMVTAVEDNGPGLYGCWGFHEPSPHIRTTVFWINNELFNAYPHDIDDDHRYEFEHGHSSITLWCQRQGFQTNMVTTRGVYSMANWHHVHREHCLFLDQHVEGIGYRDDPDWKG